MDWKELNFVIEGLEALVEKYRFQLDADDLSEDDRSDLSNDLAYAELLLGSYNDKRSAILQEHNRT